MSDAKSNTAGDILNHRYTRILYLVIITILFAVNYNNIYDRKLDMNGDNIFYYSLGKAMAEGKGFTDIMGFEEAPHVHFPPGYPMFVAGVMKIMPDSINAVKVANGILLLLSLLLLFYILSKISGNALIAFTVCILCGMHHELLRYATIMMSETLFLFCCLACLAAMLNMEPDRIFTKGHLKDKLWFVFLVLMMNYIYFVRVMGLAFILAVLFYYAILAAAGAIRYLKNRASGADLRKKAIYYTGIFAILGATLFCSRSVWEHRNQQVGKTTDDYTSTFGMKPKGERMATLEDWTTRITNNIQGYVTRYIPESIVKHQYNPESSQSSPGEWFKGIVILALMVAGLAMLKHPFALLLFLYLGATLAVLMVWPEQYGGIRYFVTVIPFMLFLFLWGIYRATLLVLSAAKFRIAGPAFVSILVSAGALFFMSPSYANMVKMQAMMASHRTWNAQIAGNAFAEFAGAMEWCGKNLPDTTRVICRKPELFFMYSGGHKSGKFSSYAKPEDIYNFLVQQKATHVIVDHWFRHAYVTLYPLITTYYPEKFRFICKFGGQDPAKDPPTLIFEFNPAWGYTGDLAEGKREGKGKLVMQDGRYFVGDFRDNKINGYGELYDGKGQLITKGIWEDDTLIKAQ